MKKLLLSLVIILFLAKANGQVTQWTDTFLNTVNPTVAQVNTWNAWRAQLTPYQYCQMWIGGTYDTTGQSCTDTAVVHAFALAIQNYTSYTSPTTCSGNIWSICNRYLGEIWLNPPAQCDGSNCPTGYIIRVGIGNLNWGGVNTPTCTSNPNQRMTFRFYGGVGTPGQIAGPDTVCFNTTHTYFLPPVNGATYYSWTVPPGATVVTGQGSNGISVLYGNTSGTVSVIATPACGTPTPATLNVGVFSCSSVEEINFALAGIKLFPNPSTGSVNLNFNSPMGDLVIEINDVQGRLVYKSSENVGSVNTTKQINAVDFANGIYSVRIITSDNVYTDKLIIKK